jgi:Anti-sigma-K factor rskA
VLAQTIRTGIIRVLADTLAQASQPMDATEINAAAPGPHPDRATPDTSTTWYRRVGLWRALTGMAIALALASAMVALEMSSELLQRSSYYHHRLLRLTGHIHEMRGQIDTADRQIADMRDEVAARQDLPLILAASDVRLFRLNPPTGGDGKGFVAMSRKVGNAVIEVSDLPHLNVEQNYTLWWVFTRRAPFRAVDFRLAADGHATAAAKLPSPEGEVTAALVTVETGDQHPTPGGTVKLRGVASKPVAKSATKRK